MKLPLKKRKPFPDGYGGIPWTACQPFVGNTRAVLIHRPRTVTTHKISKGCKTHIAVGCWCGNTMTGTKKFTFLDAPPEGKILCARCEVSAIAAGLPAAETIVGRHIHLGGVVAVKNCCGRDQQE